MTCMFNTMIMQKVLQSLYIGYWNFLDFIVEGKARLKMPKRLNEGCFQTTVVIVAKQICNQGLKIILYDFGHVLAFSSFSTLLCTHPVFPRSNDNFLQNHYNRYHLLIRTFYPPFFLWLYWSDKIVWPFLMRALFCFVNVINNKNAN